VRFRDAIAAELELRRRRDPRYSVRRFARALGVHHSTVSRLLHGTRPVPVRTVVQVAERLRMTQAQLAELLALEDAAAVVEAIGRPAFRADSRWLASVTGVSVDRVNIVLQKLLRVGSLRMRSPERWELLEGGVE
jgi:transcriptional regulator with XRE-family HTH domain